MKLLVAIAVAAVRKLTALQFELPSSVFSHLAPISTFLLKISGNMKHLNVISGPHFVLSISALGGDTVRPYSSSVLLVYAEQFSHRHAQNTYQSVTSIQPYYSAANSCDTRTLQATAPENRN
jgi:hypothetical protein